MSGLNPGSDPGLPVFKRNRYKTTERPQGGKEEARQPARVVGVGPGGRGADRPGERRVVDILRLRPRVNVFVVHDTEEPSYGFKAVLPAFRHTVTYMRDRTWTTLASDVIDVRAWFRVQSMDVAPLALGRGQAVPLRLSWMLPNRRMVRTAVKRHAPEFVRRMRHKSHRVRLNTTQRV